MCERTVVDFGHRYVNVALYENGVGHIVLDRAPVNAVNQDMYLEIRDVFSRFREVVPAARVAVVSSVGRHFCAGNDLDEFGEMTGSNVAARMRLVRETFAAIYECPVPTIAAVQGMALGTGMVIAACCDVIVGGEHARLGAPEVGVGVMGGARHLARIVPEQVMRWMYLTGDPVPAADLARFGGISAIAPDDAVVDEAFRLAERIVRHSSVALRMAKEMLNRTEFMELRAGYEVEQGGTGRLVSHPDSVEARRSALERRSPVYRHC